MPEAPTQGRAEGVQAERWLGASLEAKQVCGASCTVWLAVAWFERLPAALSGKDWPLSCDCILPTTLALHCPFFHEMMDERFFKNILSKIKRWQTSNFTGPRNPGVQAQCPG